MRAGKGLAKVALMQRPRTLLGILTLIWSVSALSLSAAEPAPAHLTDSGKWLPAEPDWAQGVEAKLATFEHTVGIKFLLEFHEKSPPADEDDKPGVYMRTLSAQRGTLDHGVLAVYFADEDDWRVWIGDALAPVFVGRPGTAQEFTASGAMHDAKEAFLTEVFAQSDAAFAARQKTAPADQPPARGERRALQVDALVDGFIRKLSPQ
ncbi:MAG: hypothetical protein KBF26_03250 [Opitutaceae bacterium]|nr:hypothetical protein [Opitutaceae bacterium]